MKILSVLLFLLSAPYSLFADTFTINDPSGGGLNLRSGPGTSFRILQEMDHGLRVDELERRGKWSNIALPSGRTGWAFRKYLKPAGPGHSGPDGVTSDHWSYADGEAGWDLVRNGYLSARVFLGRDIDTGGFYYGVYRVSDDPMIHFMGVSVAYSNGSETELAANGCYARNCLTEYHGGDGIASAQVRIPISSQDEAAILEAFKSGRDITFRYQSKASYADNSFKRMKLSLKGSRDAIDHLQSLTQAGQDH